MKYIMTYFQKLQSEVYMKIKYYGDVIEKSKKAISLCGPTPRNNKVISWRKEALDILKNIGYDGIVYVPELKNEIPVFNTKDEQLFWERNCYINSNVILFWVPRKFPSMLGLTTNVEFGYWIKSKKCIYGRPDGAYRTQYLDWLYNLEYNKKPINSLEELLKQAVKMSEENNNEKYINTWNL